MGDVAKRILIVEDEMLAAMSLAMDLRGAGYAVGRTVATGEEAVAAAQSETVDLILMDIGLAGGMDGVEAAARIRAFSSVPIIYMTGYAERANDPTVRDTRPHGFLVKPASFSRLQALLDSLDP